MRDSAKIICSAIPETYLLFLMVTYTVRPPGSWAQRHVTSVTFVT